MTEAPGAGAGKRLKVEQKSNAFVVHFLDRKILDESNIVEIANELFDLVDKNKGIHLCLNFSNVQYLSSTVLGKLITLNTRVNEDDGKLVLCAIRPQILEVFKITKLTKLFDIVDDEMTALSHFG
jgi:anti-sigma B factor antagonist